MTLDAILKAYRPSAEQPWTLARAGHLLRRAGFDPTWEELQAALKDGPQATIDRLLDAEEDPAVLARFRLTTAPSSLPKDATGTTLAACWLDRLLRTQATLRQKLTLFWHNHFATSIAKVQNARWMLQQQQTLEQHALGSFAEMLQAITTDPAMMVWLDTVGSVAGKANENYARELMELFSLGIGHYSETDIREAARAFTGYELRNDQIRFNPRKQDAGRKTILGQTGAFRANQVVSLCLDQPACASFIVTKLYRYFVSEVEAPTDEVVTTLAATLRKSWSIRSVVEQLLRSECFFSARAYRMKMKSPVEWAVGLVRSLGGSVPALALAERLEPLGQQLFAPPSVKGWDGGTSWLNAQTLLLRSNLALGLTSGNEAALRPGVDIRRWLEDREARDPETTVNVYLDLLLQGDVAKSTRDSLLRYAQAHRNLAGQRALLHLVLSCPEYQLG